MVKNPHILEAFEKKERKQSKAASVNKNWYKKADQLYKTALTLNPELQHSKSEKHLEMLVEVRKKINSMLN